MPQTTVGGCEALGAEETTQWSDDPATVSWSPTVATTGAGTSPLACALDSRAGPPTQAQTHISDSQARRTPRRRQATTVATGPATTLRAYTAAPPSRRQQPMRGRPGSGFARSAWRVAEAPERGASPEPRWLDLAARGLRADRLSGSLHEAESSPRPSVAGAPFERRGTR